MMVPERASALRPPFGVRPDLRHPEGAVAVWFTEPPGAVLQFVQPARGTLDLARWVDGPVAEALLRRFPRGTSLVIVFDLTLMTGRDAEARALIHERGKANKGRVSCTYVVPPQGAGAATMNTLHVGAALLKIFGVRVVVEPTLDAALATGGLRAARA